MSDDRADGTEDEEGRSQDSPDARQPASAAARRERAAGRSARAGDQSRGGGKDSSKAPASTDAGISIPVRVWLFIREAVAELRKVIWPTRKQLVTYFLVVLVFVALMITYISLLDLGFGKVVFFVFG